jgi:hypothetical protein
MVQKFGEMFNKMFTHISIAWMEGDKSTRKKLWCGTHTIPWWHILQKIWCAVKLMQNNLYCSVVELKLGYIVFINFGEIHVIDASWSLHEIQGFNSNQQLPSMKCSSNNGKSCNKGIRLHHFAKRWGILHVLPSYIQIFWNKIPLCDNEE